MKLVHDLDSRPAPNPVLTTHLVRRMHVICATLPDDVLLKDLLLRRNEIWNLLMANINGREAGQVKSAIRAVSRRAKTIGNVRNTDIPQLYARGGGDVRTLFVKMLFDSNFKQR